MVKRIRGLIVVAYFYRLLAFYAAHAQKRNISTIGHDIENLYSPETGSERKIKKNKNLTTLHYIT